MNSKRLRAQRGSTLIESLVALFIFGFSAATMGQLLVAHIRYQGLNQTRTTAIGLADRELENFRAMDYVDIASHSSSQTFGTVTYLVTSTVLSDVPAVNLKSIATAITWTEPSGAQTYTVNAIYTAIKR